MTIGALVLAAGHALLLAAIAGGGVGGSLAWLAPGLVAAGAGMGLLIVPLTTMIMAGMDVQQAGTASGAASTMQSVGNAIGIAITVAVAGLSRLLPAHGAR